MSIATHVHTFPQTEGEAMAYVLNMQVVFHDGFLRLKYNSSGFPTSQARRTLGQVAVCDKVRMLRD
jgi:hypothetical protein